MTDTPAAGVAHDLDACPEHGLLSDWMAERLPDDDRAVVQAHVEACPACQQRLDTLVVDGDTWNDLASELGQLPGAADTAPWALSNTGPALRDVVASLRGLDPHAVAASVPESLDLAFLAASDRPDALGRLGSYDILGVIGRGGMGLVLKALDPALERIVAVKVLAPHLSCRPDARERFLREARLSAAVRHENVIAIHAVAEADGLPYLVMPYITGESLQQRLNRGDALPVAEVARIGVQMARGLAAAHAQGIVHRDIKPANVLLEPDGRVVITDFGLARVADGAVCTESGVAVGTPAFMSPEQAQGQPLDARSDLFSLGSVLYALCCGQPPFRAREPLAILRQVADTRPTPIRKLNPTVPPWLADLVQRLHANRPEQRPAATEVAVYLERGLAHLEQPGRVPAPGSPRRPLLRVLLAAALLILVGLSATEACGWTDVLGQLGTVLRLRTADGTLVVEVDDPHIKVQLDGEDLQITGAGAHELRLKPGSYRLSATKGGQSKHEIVTIQRDSKTVLRVHFEPDLPAIAGPGGKGPFGVGNRRPLLVPPGMPQGAIEPGNSVTPVRLLVGHKGPVHSIVVTRDGKSALSCSGWPRGDGTIIQWDLITGKIMQVFNTNSGDLSALALAPDGKRFLCAGLDGTVRLGELDTGKLEPRFLEHRGEVNNVAWSPDGKAAASCGVDQTVRIWEVDTGKQRHVLHGHTDRVHGLAYSPDGKTLLSGSRDGSMRLWDAATGRELRRLLPQRGWVSSVAFLPDGRRVAIGAEHAALWDVENGKELTVYKGAAHAILQAAPAPDSKHIVTGSYDGSVRVYATDSGTQLRVLRSHQGYVWAVAFTPDGRFFLSGGGGFSQGTGFVPGSDFAIRLWELKAVLGP